MTEHAFDPDNAGESSAFEEEGPESGPSLARPWDPTKIRVQTKTFSLRQVIDDIDDGSIDVTPDFQRGYVWKDRQQTRLVESVLLGIPLPAFYFDADEESRFKVVDGVQRLTTIREYATDRFQLSRDLEYLREMAGKYFKDLNPSLRRRFHQTQIVVHVIEPTSPPEVKFDIFKRINTGGTPLNSQEIRHCMTRPRARDFLKRLAELPSFRQATGIGQCRRMEDRELALRFAAFALQARAVEGMEAYEAMTLDAFLARAAEDLGTPGSVDDETLAELESGFDLAMASAQKAFGKHAFRRSAGDRARAKLNRALFDCWSVAFAGLGRTISDEEAAKIRAEADAALTDEDQFAAAVSQGTGDPGRVLTRFRFAKEVVARHTASS